MARHIAGRAGHVPTPASVLAPDIRGRQRLSLIRDLALGEWDPTSIARMYSLHPRGGPERASEQICR